MRFAVFFAIIAAGRMVAAEGAVAATESRQDAIRAAMSEAAERQAAAVSSAMQPGLEMQRKAVRLQVSDAREQVAPSTDQFFTLPWPKPAVVQAAMAAECDPLTPAVVDSLIAASAERESLEPGLLREVMRQESGFRPCAISRAGALGLMQLMPATAEHLRVTDPFDPGMNVAAGAKYLRELLDRYAGDISLALGAYNAGPTRVDRAGAIPNIPETRNYVGAILKTLVLR